MSRQPGAAHAMQQCSIALPNIPNDAWKGKQPSTRTVKTAEKKDLGQRKIRKFE